MELAGDKTNLTTFLFADSADRTAIATTSPVSDSGEAAVDEFRLLLQTVTPSLPPLEQSDNVLDQSVLRTRGTGLSNTVNEQLATALAHPDLSESLPVSESPDESISTAVADGKNARSDDTHNENPTIDARDTSLQPANPILLTVSNIEATPRSEALSREPTRAATILPTTVTEHQSGQFAVQQDKPGDTRFSVADPGRLGGSSDSQAQSVLPHTNVFASTSGVTDDTADALGSNPRVASLQGLPPVNPEQSGPQSRESQPISPNSTAQPTVMTAPMDQSRPLAQLQSYVSSVPGPATATALPLFTAPTVTPDAKDAMPAMATVIGAASTVPPPGLSVTPANTLETASRLKTLAGIRELPSVTPGTTTIANTWGDKPSMVLNTQDLQRIHDQAVSASTNGVAATLSMGKVAVADAVSIQRRMSPGITNGRTESIVATAASSGDPVAVLTTNLTTLPTSLRAADTINIQSPQSAFDLQAPQLPTRLGGQIRLMADTGVQSAVLRIKPAELGPVHIEVSVDNDRLTVNISATQAVTRELLESALPRLREQLSPQQFSQIDVSVSTHERGQGQSAFGQPQSSADRSGADASNRSPVASRQEPDNQPVVEHRPASSSHIDAYV